MYWHIKEEIMNILFRIQEKNLGFDFYNALCALRDFLKKNNLYDELEKDFINYALHFSLWNLNTISGSCYYKLYDKLKKEVL